MDMDLIKDKLVKYAPKMEVENIALLGFGFVSLSMLIGLLIPKKLKKGLRFSCFCVACVAFATFALSVMRWEKEIKEEEKKQTEFFDLQ